VIFYINLTVTAGDLESPFMENIMKDILQKVLHFGLGVFDFTREKVEALVDEMVRRGEISQQESPEAVKELLERAQEVQAALVDKVKELVNKALAETRPAKAADLEALEKRVAALEEEVRKLKGDG
jgi:polyhydroxyalkanoate synthesis regulator phasin